jgi:nitrite reductase (NADH) small subunit
MSEFRTVAKVGEIPPGRGLVVYVEGASLALFESQGSYFALDDACPHEGVSLSRGRVFNGAVICPRHCWKFALADGSWVGHPESPMVARTYPVRVQGDEIQVLV